MKIEELYKTIKIGNINKLILIKCGSFYRTYDDDALIIWKIFGYKLTQNRVGFPMSCFGTVVARLNRLGISVISINDKQVINYDAISSDTYNEYLSSAINSNEVNKKIEELKQKISVKLDEDMCNYEKLEVFLRNL